MDTECGIIVEIRARMALVEASAGEACAACSSRGSCSLIGGESKRRLWMENRAGGRKGDTIEFAIAPGAVVRMSLLLYAFPVAALIAGMFAGMALAPRLGLDADLAAALFGAGGFALSFGIVKAISAILARGKSFQPVMIRVLGDGRADA
ncbi:MAG: SoxR reducing system RseC family protein [Spirochaetota bacterium]